MISLTDIKYVLFGVQFNHSFKLLDLYLIIFYYITVVMILMLFELTHLVFYSLPVMTLCIL